MNNLETKKDLNEAVKEAAKFYSAEVKMEGLNFAYQFKIWNIPSKPICFMIREDSEILQRLKAGDALDVKYYSSNPVYSSEYHKTVIREITKEGQGRFKGHYLVGLEISEAPSRATALNMVDRLNEKGLIEKARKLFYADKYREAIQVYTRAIKINPNSARAYFNRGVSYKKLGENQPALKDLKIAAKLGIEKAQDFLSSKGISYDSGWRMDKELKAA